MTYTAACHQRATVFQPCNIGTPVSIAAVNGICYTVDECPQLSFLHNMFDTLVWLNAHKTKARAIQVSSDTLSQWSVI